MNEKLYYLKLVQLLSMIIVMIEGKSATRNKIIFVIRYTSGNNKMLKRKQDGLMHACYVMFVI